MYDVYRSKDTEFTCKGGKVCMPMRGYPTRRWYEIAETVHSMQGRPRASSGVAAKSRSAASAGPFLRVHCFALMAKHD